VTEITRDMSNQKDMKMPKVASREEWLRARLHLLEAEKKLTRRGDEMAGGDRNCHE
jgi:predicted dithiol-disulfide oxidoreductase (DUF899 family)